MAVKDVFSKGNRVRESLLRGMEIAADIVGSTIGPRGRRVVIERSFGAPKITKDGVTVAKEIELSNRLQNLGAQALKEAANKTNEDAGDGTTTTAVLAKAIAAAGIRAVAAGMNPVDLHRGMTLATKATVEEIKRISRDIRSSEEVAQVATISAGSAEIGNMLAEAFEKVGKDGVVTVEEAKSNSTLELETIEGMSFDRGFISSYFVTNSEKMVAELENPRILVFDKKITNIQDVLHLLEGTMQAAKSLVIIAEDVESDALATLILNKLRGGLKVAAVKAPGFGDRRRAMLEDIAVITGAQLISEELGQTLKNATLDDLGSAQKIIISKDETTIIGGAGSKDNVKARCKELKVQIEQTTSDYDKEKLAERLGKLAGKVAIVRVGGITEPEVKETKSRVEDAYNATKAAIAEGIVPGGGATLLYATKALNKLSGKNADETAGVGIIKEALSAPFRRILENAGVEASSVAQKLLEQTDHNRIFDAQQQEYADAYKAGIIDPTKVVRIALESAASVAGLLITTEGAIVERQEDKKDDNRGSAKGPMDDAYGMDF